MGYEKLLFLTNLASSRVVNGTTVRCYKPSAGEPWKHDPCHNLRQYRYIGFVAIYSLVFVVARTNCIFSEFYLQTIQPTNHKTNKQTEAKHNLFGGGIVPLTGLEQSKMTFKT